jgi:polar amino acid transport system substrate-binding protein
LRRALLLPLIVLALLAAGCGGGDDEEASTSPGAQTASCEKDQLDLVNAGQLTIGTDNPAYPPWFGGEEMKPWKISNPASGEGFESAVAFAVAEELGFERADVNWTYVPFNKSFAPGPKSFDFDINQISFDPNRAKAVDFSETYYDVNQALVANKGTPIADAKSIADLKDAKLGVQIGTTSYRYITENIKPTKQPSVYDTSNDTISALNAKQIEGIVVDLPTAFYIVAAELDNGTIVGQFPNAGATPEHFGMVFEKGNPLVECVNKALRALKADGTLAQIRQEWLADKASAPVLK